MKTLSAVLLLSSVVAAQGGVGTITGYAVEAQAGSGAVQGVAAGMAIPAAGLTIRAADGAAPSGGPLAAAQTAVALQTSGTMNQPMLTVDEQGFALPDGGRRSVAGTSNDPRLGGLAPHGLRWRIPARAGTTATVVVTWNATAGNGSFATATVDVDADGSPDFAQRVAGTSLRISRRFPVQASGTGTAAGFTIDVATSGQAVGAVSSGALGGSRYGADLSITLVSDAIGCTFANFGTECAGRLDGVPPSAGGTGNRVGVRLSSAAPSSVAILAAGNRVAGPIPLPLSRCDLLVAPVVTVAGLTDASGAESWSFPLPASAPGGILLSFQAVTLIATPTGPRLGSSNGTTLICR